MARRRAKGRAVSGILPLDKPSGLSSNQALQRVRRLFGAAKAGHTGSLDPLASGLLPLCFGEATKISSYLLEADKEYEMVCRLGTRTATGDAEGDVVARVEVPPLDEPALEASLAGFRGEIEQVPPMYSAIKHQGERLYRLARQGVEVERQPRRVTIHEFELLERSGENLCLRVRCSKGTYIRVLAEDLARALGTEGHVTALRRTAAGPYRAADMIDMAQVEAAVAEGAQAADALLLPLDSALAHWPEVVLTADTAWYFRQGQPVLVPGSPASGRVRVYRETDRQFVGMGEILDDGRVAPRRLVQAA
jgi:tRNA pseudouridine55 synthase